jgi:hypothetical protein
MSDDLINQLTLNFLISKNQLQKLNKKVKENTELQKINEIEKYNERIKTLFNNLLVYQPPDDLLLDVKNSFDLFIEKSIYYFKAHDETIELEKERTNDFIHDDIDYEKEEREIEKGNFSEKSEEEEEEEEDEELLRKDENYELEQKKEELIKNYEKDNINPKIVRSKYGKQSNSIGVEDIQKLPLDWFQNARQNYQKNKIMPRKKEVIIEENGLTNCKRKI